MCLVKRSKWSFGILWTERDDYSSESKTVPRRELRRVSKWFESQAVDHVNVGSPKVGIEPPDDESGSVLPHHQYSTQEPQGAPRTSCRAAAHGCECVCVEFSCPRPCSALASKKAVLNDELKLL